MKIVSKNQFSGKTYFYTIASRLRAGLEADLKRVCEGTRQPEEVLREQINKYREVFEQSVAQVNKIDLACARYLDEAPM